jgi:hypothetical protein
LLSTLSANQGKWSMIIRGSNNTSFELKILRYEHPGTKNDNWLMNLLRVSIYIHTADGNEGTCQTYLSTSEIKWLKEWLEMISRKTPDKSPFECYSGAFRFDFTSFFGNSANLNVHFYLGGKASELPNQRDEPFGWAGEIEFSLPFSQVKGGIDALEKALIAFPERIPQKDRR